MKTNYLTKDKKPYTEDTAIREVCDVVSNALKRAYVDIPEGDVIQAYANNAISVVEAIHKDSKTLGKMFGFAGPYIRNSQCIALGEPFEMSFTSKSGSYEIAVYRDDDEWLLHLLSIEQDGNIHKYQPNPISSPAIEDCPVYTFAMSHTNALANFKECVPPNAPLQINSLTMQTHDDFLLFASKHKVVSFGINFSNGEIIGRFVNGKMESIAETSIGGSIGKVVCETVNELQHLLNFQKYMEKK